MIEIGQFLDLPPIQQIVLILPQFDTLIEILKLQPVLTNDPLTQLQQFVLDLASIEPIELSRMVFQVGVQVPDCLWPFGQDVVTSHDVGCGRVSEGKLVVAQGLYLGQLGE